MRAHVMEYHWKGAKEAKSLECVVKKEAVDFTAVRRVASFLTQKPQTSLLLRRSS
jgi:hypothetical protein